MSMHCCSPLGKIRTVVIISCLILIIGIFGYAYLTDKNNSVIDKDDIVLNVESIDAETATYDYVSSYLKKMGIGNLNTYKINSIEAQLEDDFYKDLPEEKELAKAISLLFVEHFYDSIDLEDKEAVTDAVLKCFFASIDDPYAYYRTAKEFEDYLTGLEGGEEFVGIGVLMNSETLEIIMVYPDSGAEEAGIKERDVLYAIEGEVFTKENQEELLSRMKGEPETAVNVTVKRGEELITYTVTRRTLIERSVYHNMLEGNIGYIEITQFLETTTVQFMESVDYCVANGAVALVIDVRYNPGGLVHTATEVVDYLAPDAKDRRIASYNYSGGEHVYYTTDGHSVDLPIAVICNEYTASSGELFTSALRDFGKEGIMDVVIVGTTTYGKGVLQNSYSLYDGSGITYTIGYCNPPSNVNYDGIGIIPDVEMEEIAAVDAPLSVAVEEVLKLVNSNGGALGGAAA